MKGNVLLLDDPEHNYCKSIYSISAPHSKLPRF